jgi:hypothetical protein
VKALDARVTAGGVHGMLREGYRLVPEIVEHEFVGASAGIPPGYSRRSSCG